MLDKSNGVPQAGDLIADKYRVEEVLGVGGMGMVVAARHTTLDQQVAVKFLRGEVVDHSELVSRFLQEARASFKLRGDHTVRVFDVGTLPNGAPYMVMELLSGNDLRTELDRRPQLPVVEAVDLILQTIEAIAEAHALGVVHRDLKPSNLFLAVRPDGSRSVKVLDFGVSKVLRDAGEPAQQSLTETAAMLGSPQYMSPEQIRSAREVDERTDLWSLGVVLYELLTGRVPFAGETLSAVSASIVADDPRDPVLARADLPLSLVEVIMRCLAKDRRLRYQTAAELALALKPFASPESTSRVDRISGIQSARQRQLAAQAASDANQDATLPAVTDGPPEPSSKPSARARADSGGTLGATSSQPPPTRRSGARYFGLAVAGVVLGGLVVLWLAQKRPAAPQEHANGAAPSARGVPSARPSSMSQPLHPKANPESAATAMSEATPVASAAPTPVAPTPPAAVASAAQASKNGRQAAHVRKPPPPGTKPTAAATPRAPHPDPDPPPAESAPPELAPRLDPDPLGDRK